MGCRIIPVFLLCAVATFCFAEDQIDDNTPFVFLIPFGYGFFQSGDQTIHKPALGAGFLYGEQDLPFDEVTRRFLGIALYQPMFSKQEPLSGVPKLLHQIDFLMDGRINRHQLLLIFKSAADNPVAGGFSTFQAGAGWGYEMIRQPSFSLIIGGALAVGDFGLELPSGSPLPLLPVPLIRFGVNTRWFVSSFDFLTGPNIEFTIAPKEQFRFTADMRMDNYRSINDLICEFTFWYRLFDNNHRFGDFAGVGLGFKNQSYEFALSSMETSFALQQTSIFAVADVSLLKIEAGWIFNSRHLLDGKEFRPMNNSLGGGFYLSIQGIIPISIKSYNRR